MTQRKHQSTIKCAGCGKEFGIIQQAHIDRCEGLRVRGITTRAQYKAIFGSTMSSGQIKASVRNIEERNNSLSATERISQAKTAYIAAVAKFPDLGRRGGKVGSLGLWKKEGQKESHRQRLVELNQKGFMTQKPNKLEQKFWDLVGNDSIEFCSFKFWKTISTERGFSHITPDFRIPNCDLVIEVYGNYWHDGEDPITRISQWESVGMKCLVVWEKEINEHPEFVKAKVEEFISRNLHERGAPITTNGMKI